MGGIEGGASRPDDFLAELARWAAADQVGRSVAERSRARSLQEQSAATATWAGILLDLAEGGATVTVTVGDAPKLTGRLVATARDFVVVEDRRGVPVMVRTDAICSVAPSDAGAAERPGGRRLPPLELTLAGALDALAGERAPVAVRAGTDSFKGWVVACGEDVVTIRAEGAGSRPVYLPAASLTWVELR